MMTSLRAGKMIKYADIFNRQSSRRPALAKVDSMTRMIKICVASILLFATSFAVASDYPERPSIPDGSTASKEDLLAAKNSVQDFIAKVDEYLTCIETAEKTAVAELDNPSAEELARRDEMLNKRFDAANEEKVLVGEQFNQQIRAYNAKVQDNKE
jgi:hypothetical protein